MTMEEQQNSSGVGNATEQEEPLSVTEGLVGDENATAHDDEVDVEEEGERPPSPAAAPEPAPEPLNVSDAAAAAAAATEQPPSATPTEAPDTTPTTTIPLPTASESAASEAVIPEDEVDVDTMKYRALPSDEETNAAAEPLDTTTTTTTHAKETAPIAKETAPVAKDTDKDATADVSKDEVDVDAVTEQRASSGRNLIPVDDKELDLAAVMTMSLSSDEADSEVMKLKSPTTKTVDPGDKKPLASMALTEPASIMFLSGSSSPHDAEADHNKNENCHSTWIRRYVHGTIVGALQLISGVAVAYPRTTLVVLSFVSAGLLAAGLMTNFEVETGTAELWPPQHSLSIDQHYWLFEDSKFNYNPVQMDLIIHKDGDNVLGQTGVDRVFEAYEAFTNLRGWREGCAWAEQFGDFYWVGQCLSTSVTDFWNESLVEYLHDVKSDNDTIEALSAKVYPNDVLVDVETIMGNAQYDPDTGLLTSVDSYLMRFGIPWSNVTLRFENHAIWRMKRLRDKWMERGDEYKLEVRSHSSYSDEFIRAIVDDLWLLPIAFSIVVLFTVFFAFGKCHRVYSRGLLGVGAVVTIVGSLMTSFGILFIIGIPFTTQTMMVPFIMFGIGLDDAFIIFGSYNRKAHIQDTKDRVKSTINDVGVSIFLTSLTSMLAFVLGSLSQIPAISWLCLYAFPCVGIDFFYQITFFVALVVVDEERIKQNRMDWITCIKVKDSDKADEDEEDEEDGTGSSIGGIGSGSAANGIIPPLPDNNAITPGSTHRADQLMAWWANQLLKRWVQIVALIAYVGIAAGSVYCVTQLEQVFDFTAMVPKDSYVKAYYDALDAHSERDGVWAHAYFRNVDQSDPIVQDQMEAYIADLVARGNVDAPVYFWLWDFKTYSEEQSQVVNSTFHELDFHMQVDQFLKVPIYNELYDEEIGRSRYRIVWESRCQIHINVDVKDSKATTDMLDLVREIDASQDINKGLDDWKFFTFTGEFHLFEFYNRVVEELKFTSIMSVVAVSVIALIFVPHWSAVLFVFPFISMLYINMLGFLYLSGVQINAISYVTLVMSVGIMVDYIMHILMRYYECSGPRAKRVRDTMSSIGAAIFLGAASTLLGVLCLSFSTSDILQDIFVFCVGLITFGVLNGLIFLPVVLSWVGPE